MRKQTLATVLIIVTSFTFLAGCLSSHPQDNTSQNNLDRLELIGKANYFSEFWFDSNVGSYALIVDAFLDEKYQHLAPAYSKEEAGAANYDNDVVVVWPTQNTEYILSSVNAYIRIKNVDMAQFSLPNTLTVTDIIENRENVQEFLDSLSVSDRYYVLDPRHAPSRE